MIGSDVMAIINMHEADSDFHHLSSTRLRGMMPFAGRYRLIDFPLSRLVNTGIKDVSVLVPCKIGSLVDHLRNAKTYDLMRNNGGLFLLLPKDSSYEVNHIFKRDLEQLYTYIDVLKGSDKEYVLMTGTSTLTGNHYVDMIEDHISSKADITLMYTSNPGWVKYSEKVMSLVLDGPRIKAVQYVQADMDEPINTNLMKFVIRRELLINLLEECRERGETDIYKDIIFRNLDRLHVRGFRYDGYSMHINSHHTYFKYSMELLDPKVREFLFNLENPVYTRSRNEAPTVYKMGAKVENSLISNGCQIEGVVENSILFRGVTVAKGAIVRNSIIMEHGHIGEGTVLDYVVADRGVHFLPDRKIKGERSYPTIIEKGSVV